MPDVELAPGRSAAVSEEAALRDVLDRALGAAGGAQRWSVTATGPWYSVAPHDTVLPAQGWKLHLSATPASATDVLERAVPVLLEGNASFKFLATIADVVRQNSRTTPRGSSGKFLTVYPADDAEALRLAEALHRATVGLAGPRVLSDRPYASEGVVHYRYGAFVEQRRLGNDGLYSWIILDPDGNPVEDRRVGQYLPPSWARCPFPESESEPVDTSGPSAPADGGVLIGGRFLAREAIRHTNKGGVYRVVDTQTGADAIVKEARPHVDADESGRDVRDLLRAEAGALEKIAPLGVAPRLLSLFEQSGHLFLAEEQVPGVSLQQWVLDRFRDSGWRRAIPDALAVASRLVELMAASHRGGVILRDFNPTNIMVRPDGGLRLVDLELAALLGEEKDELSRAGTPGFVAPEQMDGARPAPEADCFSLGATLCFVVTGSAPTLLPDEPRSRDMRSRLAEWLAVRTPDEAEIRSLVLALMDDDPKRRFTTTDTARALAAARRRSRPDTAPSEGSSDDQCIDDQCSDDQWQDAVDGIVGTLLSSMNPDDTDRLWPASPAHPAPDPCAVHLGAAGVLGVLTRYVELTGHERAADAVSTVGTWVSRRLAADPDRSPGLNFGAAGVAWSLYEAGRVLGDDRLAERGLDVARTLPVSSPNPDVTHGTAGLGMTFLHLWLRTGREEFAAGADASADALVGSASEEDDGLIWGTPAAFDSRVAGGRFYGFAHGTAGVGAFLLASGRARGRSDSMALAQRAGETLLEHALTDQAAQWGAGPGDPPTAPYWCHGAAGIGSFLTRLHRVTGDGRFGAMAGMSARAVVENSWRGVLGQCHGLAGNGEFLLDLAEFSGATHGPGGGDGPHTLAHRLARIVYASRAYRDGRAVFPDEAGGVTASWADGMSGILAFLLRLRYASPRLWMVDSVLDRGDRA